MVTPNHAGLVAAESKLRAILAAKSTWMVNYNSVVSDADMVTYMTEIITAYLIASQPKGN